MTQMAFIIVMLLIEERIELEILLWAEFWIKQNLKHSTYCNHFE